ncbi:MAG: thioredoxin [Clostridia bacterium]|nr:thioredoxin [Clostridia bacterium]
MKTLNAGNFTEEIRSKDLYVVDFFADWCGPCRMLAPLLAELEAENPSVSFGKLNVDEAPQIAGQYGIQSIPYVVLFKKGEIAAVSIGFKPKAELKNALGI